MRSSANGAADAAAPPEPEPAPVPPAARGQLDGIEEFGSLKNWLSFDGPRGKLVCRTLDSEYDEFQAMILESRVTRSLRDEDGNVLCASSDRVSADTGRVGKECAVCEDRDEHCFPRWFLAWLDCESGMVFAHTLSTTASYNFTRYATALQKADLQPGDVLTRIFVEEARRRKTGTTYRRLQFEQVAEEENRRTEERR